MLEVRQDYDFNQRPDNPVDQGKPLNCNISVNLRNVLQVVNHEYVSETIYGFFLSPSPSFRKIYEMFFCKFGVFF